MRKLIVLFFLAFLPLQWSATAVAAYCQHEEDAQSQQHLGHHSHQHQADDTPADSGSGGFGDFDADCPSCHALCIHGIAVFLTPDHGDLAGQVPAIYRAAVPDPRLESPYRPPLARLV